MPHLFTIVLAAIVYASPTPSPTPSATPLPPPPPTAGGVPWSASDRAALRAGVEHLLTAPTLRGAQVGLIATDTARGTVLFSQNADQEFMPASNFKLLVGSVALARLGTAFHYTTTVLSDGTVANGVLHGNLYLRGGGDALLTVDDLTAAAAALATRGIVRIDGAVVTDASRYDAKRYADGWSWDDLPYYYAPVISALELEDGTLHMRFMPSSLNTPATLLVWPQSSAYTLDNQLTTGAPGSKDTSDLSRPWDQPRTIRVSGSYPSGAKESNDVSPSVPDPASYAGDVFLRALTTHGIDVHGTLESGVAPAQATVLWTHDSEPLPQLLSDFWEPSDNLMGELLLKELAAHDGALPGTSERGAAIEAAYLRTIGVDPTTVTIADGSGLSQYDRITPRALHAILQADWNSPNRMVVLNALPVAGARGSLKKSYRGTPAQGAVFAKTGSINHVRTISGFIRTRSHGSVTFSLLVNQWMGEDAADGAAKLADARAAILSEFAKR